MTIVTNENTPTGNDRRPLGRITDPVDQLRRIAARVHDLEKEAALIGADLLHLEAEVQQSTAAPRVPALAYTIEEVGEAIGVGRTTVYSMFNSGELPTFRRGDSLRRVLVEDLIAYLRAHRDGASDGNGTHTTSNTTDADAGTTS